MKSNVPFKFFVLQGYSQGGVAKITEAIASELQKKGLAVTVGVYEKNPQSSLPQLTFKEPTWLPSSFRSLYTSLQWRWRYAHQFQAVYAHTLGAWKTKQNVLFIHDAADFDERIKSCPTIWHRLAYRLWHWLYLNLCFKQAALIFSATNAFTDYLLRHNIVQKNIVASGSWYNDQIFNYKQRLQPHDPLRLVFIGNPEEVGKNFAYVKKHFYKKTNFLVSIIGGNKKYQDNNFNFLGNLSAQKVAEVLYDSDIFIMPSLVEGFSIALLEAVATGIPCLVNTTVINEELRSSSNILPFNLANDAIKHVEKIAASYGQFNQPAAGITKFSKSVLAGQEVDTMQKYH